MRALWPISFLITTSLFACPDLSGKYATCRSVTDNSITSSDMVVSQTVRNKVTTYSVSATNASTGERETETYKADGKAKTDVFRDPDTGMALETKTIATCSGATLDIKVEVKFDGDVFGTSRVKVLKNGQELIMESVYITDGEEKTDTEICL